MDMLQRCFPALFITYILLFFSPLPASSIPVNHNNSRNNIHPRRQDDLLTPFPPSFEQVHPWEAEGKPFTLRIMPLGASITKGYGTTPINSPNGYRKPLREQLRSRGWPVNMVGSESDGDSYTFSNRQHEGHYGNTVAAMIAWSDLTIPRMPNVVLINAGTNDAAGVNNSIPAQAPSLMYQTITHLYENIPGVTIILSTLTPRRDKFNPNVILINKGYRDLYRYLTNAGMKIVLAEMNNGLLDPRTDYFDDIHPNDLGAQKMATVWDQAIAVAEERGFLSPPIDTGIPDTGDEDSDGILENVLGPE